jgi:hypothetical protein
MTGKKRSKFEMICKFVVVTFLVAIVLFGGMAVEPRLGTVKAQGECRALSAASCQSILQAFTTRTGFNTYIVRFATRTPYAVPCNFISCNIDKYTFKPLLSSNIAGVSGGGGCNGTFSIATPTSGQYYQFTLGFKVRFRNLSTGLPGTPLRKTCQLFGDFPPCAPGDTCASEEEVEVTNLLADAPDDGEN